MSEKVIYVVESPDGKHTYLEREPLEGWEVWAKGLKVGWKVSKFAHVSTVEYK